MNDERCLSDSGMPSDQIQTVISCLQAGKKKETAAILKAWRTGLLDQLHVCQKRIDCLDFFLQNHKEELQ